MVTIHNVDGNFSSSTTDSCVNSCELKMLLTPHNIPKLSHEQFKENGPTDDQFESLVGLVPRI